MGEKEERCGTGISGFDELCEGGFVKDSINLVLGNAGSGKTTFLLHFIYNGALKNNHNGLYVTFEQDIEDLERAGKKQGMDFNKLKKDNKVDFLKFGADTTIKEIQKELIKRVAKGDIKRICLDPINVFSLELAREVGLRKQLYDFLSLLKQLDVCVLIAGESDGETNEGYNLSQEISFCKYLVDGVIELYSSGISGSGDRAIRISKMRMTNHKRGPCEMKISENGLKVLKN
jgi:KaiC/GvpD/RAD55 family RecA-like ATPase